MRYSAVLPHESLLSLYQQYVRFVSQNFPEGAYKIPRSAEIAENTAKINNLGFKILRTLITTTWYLNSIAKETKVLLN